MEFCLSVPGKYRINNGVIDITTEKHSNLIFQQYVKIGLPKQILVL